MAKLIKNGKVVDDNWQVLPADATEVPAGPVIVPLATGTVQSMCRFVMVLFPLYLLAAKLCSSERMAPLLLVLACSLLTGMCAMLAFLVTAAMA